MQLKTTMRYHHLTLVRMAIIKKSISKKEKKKSISNKCWRGCGEEGTLVRCWWECRLVQPLWKTGQRFLKKPKLPYDPTIPLLDMYPEKNLIRKDTCTPVCIAALFIIAMTCKQPKFPLTYDR